MLETVATKQTKFLNGEIAPSSYGDTTHPKYPASLKTCLNWIPIPQGALVKRPGLKFIAPVKDASYTPRLIKFVFSDNQTFVLEVGNLYVRFYQRGRYVGIDNALHTYGDSYVGGYYELVTPWTTAMLPYLKFAQVGDVITIAYGGQASGVASIASRDLRHPAGALGPWMLGLTPLQIPTGAVTWSGGGPVDAVLGYQSTGATTGPVWNKGERAFQLDGASVLTEWICIQEGTKGSNQKPPDPAALNSTSQSVAGNLFWMPAVDLAHPAIKSRLVQTAVVQDANGVTYESAPSPACTINSSLSSDRQRPFIVAQATLAAGYTLLYNRFYRSTIGGAYGWIADVYSANFVSYPVATDIPSGASWDKTHCFLDDGRAPDYTKQPPAGTDPFLVNGADSYPSVVGYLDQRRLWAATSAFPSNLFLSKIGDLYNYDSRNTPGADTDAMILTIASEVLEQVRSFVAMRRGLILTGQGEWAIAGATGGPVSRSSYDIKRQSKWGSSWLNPIVIGTGVLFNTAKSNMVRDLYPLYGLYSDIWDGQDLSVMARHLLDLHTLKDWDFQSVPYPVVWAVRDDGVMLSLTYQHAPPSFGQQLAEGIVAWAQHTTGVGSDAFEAVCVVPEPPDDAVYTIVKRVVNGVTVRNHERMSSPICDASPYKSGTSDVRYGKYVDAFVAYDGHNDQIGYAAVNATIDSVTNPGSANPADYAIGKQIKITIAGGPFVVADSDPTYPSAFVFDPENSLALGIAKAHVVGFTSTAQVIAELDTDLTLAQVTAWRAGTQPWAIAKGRVTAAHLSGYQQDTGDANLARGVICLADGDVQVPAAWAAGVAYLSTPAVVIQFGIAYNADVLLLDAYHANVEIRNRLKNVLRIGFEVAGTRDMWVGKDFSNLDQWVERQVADAYGVMGLQTGYFEAFVTGEWNKSAQGAVRHFQPLPAVLTSVLREMRLGDT